MEVEVKAGAELGNKELNIFKSSDTLIYNYQTDNNSIAIIICLVVLEIEY